MKNINIPGVFPLVIAMLLGFCALKSHFGVKSHGTFSYKFSRVICGAGAVIYVLMACFQVADSLGWLS